MINLDRRSLIIGAPFLLIGCDSGTSPAPAPTPVPIPGTGAVSTVSPDIRVPNSPWRAQNSLSVVMESAPGGFAFNFPAQDGVHYVTRPPEKAPSGTMTIKYRIDSTSPVWAFKGDEPPPQMSAFVQRNGDQLGADTPDNRYWFSPRGQLDPGEHTIVAPLDISGWSNVVGQKNAAGFITTLNNCANVGMTFGGKSFAGHGVWVTGGNARFTLLSFNIG